MTYKIESIGNNGMNKIQEDLRRQERYARLSVDRLLISGPRQKWAIDEARHRYLHRCQFPGPEDAFHFFIDGRSYKFIIPNSLFETHCVAEFLTQPDDPQTVSSAIQEAFDTFGRLGFGPDDDEFSEVILSPYAEG